MGTCGRKGDAVFIEVFDGLGLAVFLDDEVFLA